MPDTHPTPQETAAPSIEQEAPTTGHVDHFHIGAVRQFVAGAVARAQLRVPDPRPAFGTDEEGNPRPDPSLAPEEPTEESAARPARAAGGQTGTSRESQQHETRGGR